MWVYECGWVLPLGDRRLCVVGEKGLEAAAGVAVALWWLGGSRKAVEGGVVDGWVEASAKGVAGVGACRTTRCEVVRSLRRRAMLAQSYTDRRARELRMTH